MFTERFFESIKKLEKEKIIRGYTAIIDHEKLGYSLTAIIEIIAKNDKIVEIEDEISNSYRCNQRSDLIWLCESKWF